MTDLKTVQEMLRSAGILNELQKLEGQPFRVGERLILHDGSDCDVLIVKLESDRRLEVKEISTGETYTINVLRGSLTRVDPETQTIGYIIETDGVQFEFSIDGSLKDLSPRDDYFLY